MFNKPFDIRDVEIPETLTFSWCIEDITNKDTIYSIRKIVILSKRKIVLFNNSEPEYIYSEKGYTQDEFEDFIKKFNFIKKLVK